MHSLISSFILEACLRRQFAGRFAAASLSLDIAGFTALTEALAQHGPAGSGALADALSALFEPLVHRIHAQGGFITHFTGDGFTALFPGPEAPAARRALAAGSAIRRHLLAHPACVTPFGAFPLAARVGVAQGEVVWGILPAGSGMPHGWYFSGPAMRDCIRVQQGAGQGEVAVSEAIAARRAGSVEDQPEREGEERPAPALAAAAASFLPPALGQLTGRGEFRNAVAVFLAVQGIHDREALAAFIAVIFELQRRHGGYLSSVNWEDDGCTVVLFWGAPIAYENDTEAALSFVLDAQAQVARPIRAGVTYRVTYAGLVGAAERADYGCYGPGTNLAARMMQAAGWGQIWLDEAIARCAAAPAHTATTHFAVEPLGARAFKGFAAPQAVYGLQGRRAVGSAARFSGPLAGRRHELAQLTAAIEPLLAGQPAGIIAILGEAGIGKSRLLHELQQTLHAVGAGEEPAAAAQAGAPLGGSAPGAVTWFNCPADEIHRYSLGPFRQLVRAYFTQAAAGDAPSQEQTRRFIDRLGALIAALRDERLHAGDPTERSTARLNPPTSERSRRGLAEALERGLPFLAALADLHWPDSRYEQMEPKARYDNTLAALQAFLLAASRIRPVILALEDAHWLDADSVSFLHTLSHNLDDAPLALLLVSREPLPLDGYAAALPRQALHLSALSGEELATLARGQLGTPAAPGLVTALQARTEGNPFFAEQLLHHLREQGLLAPSAAGLTPVAGAAALPADVRGVLIARVDRLAPPVRETVQGAAVLGREFETAVLAEFAADRTTLEHRVADAATAGIWAPLDSVRYQFQHALLRDAVYDMQLRGRLRQLHGMAAEALARIHAANLAPIYGDLAYHYGRAENTGQERRYAQLAGERAAAQFANAEAVIYLSRALALTPEDAPVERYTLLLARMRVYDLQGARAAQREDLNALAALAERLNDDAKRAEAAVQAARYAYLTGDTRAALDDAERAAALVPAVSEMATRAHLIWGKAACWLGDYPAARVQLSTALAGAQAIGLAQNEADCRLNLGIVSYSETDFARARTEITEALRVSRTCGDRRIESMALGTLGSIAFDQGDYAEAQPWFEQALRAGGEIGDRLNQGTSLGNLCNIALYRGQYDAARAYAEEALAIFRAVQALYGATVAYHVLGQIARNQGDAAAATAHYEQSLQLAREMEGKSEEGETLASLGLLHHQTGDNHGAERLCREALAVVEELGEQHVRTYALTNLGHALAGLGDLAGAAAAHQQALAARRAAGEKTRALENLAGLGEIALAEGDLAQARQTVEEILAHLALAPVDGAEEPLRIYLACYRVLQASHDPRASGVLETAHRLLTERAAQISDAALRQSYLENAPVHRALAQAARAKAADPLTDAYKLR